MKINIKFVASLHIYSTEKWTKGNIEQEEEEDDDEEQEVIVFCNGGGFLSVKDAFSETGYPAFYR